MSQQFIKTHNLSGISTGIISTDLIQKRVSNIKPFASLAVSILMFVISMALLALVFS